MREVRSWSAVSADLRAERFEQAVAQDSGRHHEVVLVLRQIDNAQPVREQGGIAGGCSLAILLEGANCRGSIVVGVAAVGVTFVRRRGRDVLGRGEAKAGAQPLRDVLVGHRADEGGRPSEHDRLLFEHAQRLRHGLADAAGDVAEAHLVGGAAGDLGGAVVRLAGAEHVRARRPVLGDVEAGEHHQRDDAEHHGDGDDGETLVAARALIALTARTDARRSGSAISLAAVPGHVCGPPPGAPPRCASYRRGRPAGTLLTRTCSAVYGSRAMWRARLIACARSRWHLAVQPPRRRASIFPRSVR